MIKRLLKWGKATTPAFPRYFHHKDTGILIKAESDHAYTRYYTTIGDGNRFTQEEVTLKAGKASNFFGGQSWTEIQKPEFDRLIERQFATRAHWQNSKPIEFAFEVDGVPYYTWSNLWDMPIGRASEAEVVFMEFDARMDRDYIEQAFTAIRDKTKGADLDLGGIAVIAQDAIHRLNMLTDWNVYEKAASVLYFDDAEDVSCYDFEYNRRKLERWRTQGRDFFLSMPLAKSIGFDKQSEGDFLTNLNRANVLRNLVSERLSQLSSAT